MDMDDGQRRQAKARLVAGMLNGRPWAAAAAEVRTSRTAAYRL